MVVFRGGVIRKICVFVVGVVVLVACGSGESLPNVERRLNSVLCYSTQDEKDIAVNKAKDKLDQLKANSEGPELEAKLVTAKDALATGKAAEEAATTAKVAAEGKQKSLDDDVVKKQGQVDVLKADLDKILADDKAKTKDKNDAGDKFSSAKADYETAKTAAQGYAPTLATASEKETSAKASTVALERAHDSAATDVDNWKLGPGSDITAAENELTTATDQTLCDPKEDGATTYRCVFQASVVDAQTQVDLVPAESTECNAEPSMGSDGIRGTFFSFKIGEKEVYSLESSAVPVDGIIKFNYEDPKDGETSYRCVFQVNIVADQIQFDLVPADSNDCLATSTIGTNLFGDSFVSFLVEKNQVHYLEISAVPVDGIIKFDYEDPKFDGETTGYHCFYSFPEGSLDINNPYFNLVSEKSTDCVVDVEVGEHDGIGNAFTFRKDGEVVHVFYLEWGGPTETEFGSIDQDGNSTNDQPSGVCVINWSVSDTHEVTYVVDYQASQNCPDDLEMISNYVSFDHALYMDLESRGVSLGKWDSRVSPGGNIVYKHYFDAWQPEELDSTTYSCQVEATLDNISWVCPTNIFVKFGAFNDVNDYWSSCLSSGSVGRDEYAKGEGPVEYIFVNDKDEMFLSGDTKNSEGYGSFTFDVTQAQSDACNRGGGEVQEPVDGECVANFSSEGFEFSCANGYLINFFYFARKFGFVSQSCVSEGIINVQSYNFGFAGKDIEFAGAGADYQGQQIFTVPIKGNPCYPSDMPELKYSGIVGDQSDVIEFTVPDGFEGDVVIDFRWTCDEDLYFDDIEDANGNEYDYGYEVGDDEGVCFFTLHSELDAGVYRLEIDREYPDDLSWSSNLEIAPVDFQLPPTEFKYVYLDTEKYFFELSTTTHVVLTATAGQTCTVWQDENSDFADPHIGLSTLSGMYLNGNDHGGRGIGNCSASLIELDLEPGKYIIKARNKGLIGAPVTLGSSIELEKENIVYRLQSQTVKGGESFEIVVPEGGSWFWAETITGQTNRRRWPEGYGNKIAVGCENPDKDNGTEDGSCVLTNSQIQSKDGGFSEWSSYYEGHNTIEIIDGLEWEATYVVGNSYFESFLPQGTYIITTQKADWSRNDLTLVSYEFKFGFGSQSNEKPLPLDIVVVNTPPQSDSPITAELPIVGLTHNGNSSVTVLDEVKTMVCNAGCIESLFAVTGLTDGVITVTAGDDAIKIFQGQTLAIIPIDMGARRLKVTALSADGTKTVSLSTKIDRMSADEMTELRESFVAVAPQSQTKTVVTVPTPIVPINDESQSKEVGSWCQCWMIILLLLIVVFIQLLILGWLYLIFKRRKSESSTD